MGDEREVRTPPRSQGVQHTAAIPVKSITDSRFSFPLPPSGGQGPGCPKDIHLENLEREKTGVAGA